MPDVHPQSSNALSQANERFELIAKATQDTIWDWDLRTNSLWWNENFSTMFGVREEPHVLDISSWYERIHPEDRERVEKSLHAVIDHGGSHWQDEYRFLKSDGTYAYVFDRGYTLHDERGPYRMVGSMLDITAQKNAQQKRAESEERLRIALESAQLGIWDMNPDTGELRWDKGAGSSSDFQKMHMLITMFS